MKKILAEAIFYIHLIIFVLFPAGFFIPSQIWPARIEYHFWFSLGLFILFYAWGLIWTIKYRNKIHAICMLDTLTQKLRGHSIWSPQNYEHSFVEELSQRFNLIPIPKKVIPLLPLGCVILSGILYILKLRGVVLY